MCILLRATLRGAPWRVDACTSGEEALAVLDHETFEVVVVDRHLPGMSGVELARAIRARGNDCALVMVTGLASLDLGRELLQLGFSALLDKPFESIGSLTSAVEQAFEQVQRRRELARALAEEVVRGPWREAGQGPLTILAIGSGVDERRRLLALVSRPGDRVVEAVSTQGAPRLLSAFRPQVCVVDLTDGAEPELASLASLVRNAPFTRFAVVVSEVTLDRMRQLMSLGVRGALQAPVDAAQVGLFVDDVVAPSRFFAAHGQGRPLPAR